MRAKMSVCSCVGVFLELTHAKLTDGLTNFPDQTSFLLRRVSGRVLLQCCFSRRASKREFSNLGGALLSSHMFRFSSEIYVFVSFSRFKKYFSESVDDGLKSLHIPAFRSFSVRPTVFFFRFFLA